MSITAIQLPKRDYSQQVDSTDLSEFLAWLQSSSMTEAETSAQRIRLNIGRFNQKYLTPQERLKLLRQTCYAADEITQILGQQRRALASPLKQKSRFYADLERSIYEVMADGFKLVYADMAELSKSGVENQIGGTALCFAVTYLAKQLLVDYECYIAPPAGLWLELHALYFIAHDAGLHTQQCRDRDGQQIMSLDHAYKSILILSIADPYHLMQGEAVIVYELMSGWSHVCHIEHIQSPVNVAGEFYIAPELDGGPRYVPLEEAEQIDRGVLVKDAGVVDMVEQAAKQLMDEHRRDLGNTPLTLNRRIRRNLLMRLKLALVGRKERKHDRLPLEGGVMMAIGFNAAHHFLSAERPFTPELDELRVNKIDFKTVQTGLSLMPIDEESWDMKEAESGLESGVYEPRKSVFDAHDPAVDTWEKIYSSKGRRSDGLLKYHLMSWTINNKSRGGLSLSADLEEGIEPVVGSVVVFRSDGKQGADQWYVGTISWMLRDEIVRIGVRFLADKVIPVGVRAVEGTGVGGEYLRCLVINSANIAEGNSKFMAPTAIYDSHTLVAINTTKSITYVRLNDVLETTNSYSLFDMVLDKKPNSESEKLDELRKRFTSAF